MGEYVCGLVRRGRGGPLTGAGRVVRQASVDPSVPASAIRLR
ncbi:hypothetical protein D187_004871 [Cystobacter fuscus DSM 2262]|uniref:Uncharacterized protein n=1 Tax=Cystobacter fuscus (strain ATCC 25194 / DSM 2262 / NBRC 100088 / M29) TaxID=1242864 RepID=S9P3C1_CYSF2|nr:hypothetical protein D187_004871 [Cystobacter fuscus DSM 2262]